MRFREGIPLKWRIEFISMIFGPGLFCILAIKVFHFHFVMLFLIGCLAVFI